MSEVKNASIRTLDGGDKLTLDEVVIEDTTVTITFHEPLQRGREGVRLLLLKTPFRGVNPRC